MTPARPFLNERNDRLHMRKESSMTPEEQIANMTKAINQAIKVMGDRFGSTEADVARAIQGLKESMQKSPSAQTASPTQIAAPVPA
jgi:hypothetical protein